LKPASLPLALATGEPRAQRERKRKRKRNKGEGNTSAPSKNVDALAGRVDQVVARGELLALCQPNAGAGAASSQQPNPGGQGRESSAHRLVSFSPVASRTRSNPTKWQPGWPSRFYAICDDGENSGLLQDRTHLVALPTASRVARSAGLGLGEGHLRSQRKRNLGLRARGLLSAGLWS
jgi:hypothetical protein